jgi:ABC-type Mn2+/Zn2+ transport system permease subunit
MNWLLEPFHHEFMQRAFLACALIGFTNGFLSAFIVLRRLALMADALSHALLPGLAVGVMLFGLAPLSLFSGALVAALLVGLGAELISRSSRVKEETALAVLYTVAFSAGIVLLSFAPVRVDLHEYLFGNILGVSNADLWTTYGISFVTILTLVVLQRPLFLMLFDPSVAATQGVRVSLLNYVLITLLVLSMISSLQAVGVILALGLLVAPAATVYLLSDSCAALFWGGGVVGAFGSCAGLMISYWLNLPAGACIVLLLGLMFFAAFILSPRYGVLRRFFNRGHLHKESLARWKQHDH